MATLMKTSFRATHGFSRLASTRVQLYTRLAVNKAFYSSSFETTNKKHIYQVTYRPVSAETNTELGSQSDLKTQSTRLAIITMKNPPVNMFGLEQVVELRELLSKLEEDKSVRGLVITSEVKNIFSAGIDLNTFLGDSLSLEKFWYQVCKLFGVLYGSRLLTVAAINGHSLALGSVIMLACHDRYALNGSYKLGLNEVQVGLTLPLWLAELLVKVVGTRNAELLGADGCVVGVNEALKCGLIDKVFDGNDALLEGSIERIRLRSKCPERAQTGSMAAIRGEFLAKFNSNIDSQVQNFVQMVKSEETQAYIKRTISSLAAKRS
ncbi:hypothetical protein BB561_000366 [Smittium simulii]|uniref:Uncharacterized protein n=1 Tax=Smittium simulii TaxID=133385 RepID=A0A2T9YZE3_9FUNG|nr:hypothetical protein BB561_000366 [Smittium simulii]